MSKDKKFTKDLIYFRSITDAISFAYKKTIGMLTLDDISNNLSDNISEYSKNSIRDTSNVIKILFIKFLI